MSLCGIVLLDGSPYEIPRPLRVVLTSELAGALDHDVDLLQAAEQLLVVVGADLVAVDEIAVQIVQLHVALAHVLPATMSQRHHADAKCAVSMRDQCTTCCMLLLERATSRDERFTDTTHP